MHGEIDGVEAEAVDAAVEPEAGGVQQGVLDRGIVQVQLGLLRQEIVHVVLAAAGVPGPRRAGEDGLPVVGRRAVGFRIGPDVPVGLRAVAGLATVAEPVVLIRGVGEDQISDDLQAEGMGPRDQVVEISQGSEGRIDVAIVGDVIAEILHRRGEEGAEPDSVDAEGGDVVEMLRDPGQVADAVAVRVGEAARIDLIDDGAPPPVGGDCGNGQRVLNLVGHARPSDSIRRRAMRRDFATPGGRAIGGWMAEPEG